MKDVIQADDPVWNALAELVECARLRGDNDLPHPADDAKLWTARMAEAWGEAEHLVDNPPERLSASNELVEAGWRDIASAKKNEMILITRFAPGTQWHGRMAVDIKTDDRGFGHFNQWYPPTHWRPLPSPPQLHGVETLS